MIKSVYIFSAHKNHRYKMSTSAGGSGFCDCGDKGITCLKIKINLDLIKYISRSIRGLEVVPLL